MKELALHILDIAQNSVVAGAGQLKIMLKEESDQKQVLTVEDDGSGMDNEKLSRVEDPFFTSRTTRKVGLGIPLLKQHAEMTGGSFLINSEKGKGTCIEAVFIKGHPDRQPLGDLEGVWMMLVCAHPQIEWTLSLQTGEGVYSISSEEIKLALELDRIEGRELTGQLKRMIRNNMEELGIS